jgi:hypothetical protein
MWIFWSSSESSSPINKYFLMKEYFDKIKENFMRNYQDHLKRNQELKEMILERQQELELYEQNQEQVTRLTE